MSRRLQVLLDEVELREIHEIAERHNMTVSEWVRQALRDARRREPSRQTEQKVASIRAAAEHAFPAPDIETMLDEIERGYLGP